MKKNILLTQPSFNNKEIKNVVKTINSGWVTQGILVKWPINLSTK